MYGPPLLLLLVLYLTHSFKLSLSEHTPVTLAVNARFACPPVLSRQDTVERCLAKHPLHSALDRRFPGSGVALVRRRHQRIAGTKTSQGCRSKLLGVEMRVSSCKLSHTKCERVCQWLVGY